MGKRGRVLSEGVTRSAFHFYRTNHSGYPGKRTGCLWAKVRAMRMVISDWILVPFESTAPRALPMDRDYGVREKEKCYGFFLGFGLNSWKSVASVLRGSV